VKRVSIIFIFLSLVLGVFYYVKLRTIEVSVFFFEKSISSKFALKLNRKYDAIGVFEALQIDECQKKGVILPFFLLPEMSEEAKNTLRKPLKVIFGKNNIVNNQFVQTSSPVLYEKYVSNIRSRKKLPSKLLIDLLRPLNPPKVSSGIEGIDCVYVINLDEKPHRWEAVKKQFDAQGIVPYRVSAINGWKIPKEHAAQLFDEDSYLLNEPFLGALGCLLSHVSVYKNALERGFKTIWICEDDIEFKQNGAKISQLVKELYRLDPQWDFFYTDYSLTGTGVHCPRPGHPLYPVVESRSSQNLTKTHGRYNTHSMVFSKRGLQKVYKYLTSGFLWAPIDIDIHNTPNLKEYTAIEAVVTSIYDSSVEAIDGSSDTQPFSLLNPTNPVLKDQSY